MLTICCFDPFTGQSIDDHNDALISRVQRHSCKKLQGRSHVQLDVGHPELAQLWTRLTPEIEKFHGYYLPLIWLHLVCQTAISRPVSVWLLNLLFHVLQDWIRHRCQDTAHGCQPDMLRFACIQHRYHLSSWHHATFDIQVSPF